MGVFEGSCRFMEKCIFGCILSLVGLVFSAIFLVNMIILENGTFVWFLISSLILLIGMYICFREAYPAKSGIYSVSSVNDSK